MSYRRQIYEIKQFKGLFQSARTRFAPEYFIDGKNFVINDEGYAEKIWGSRKSYGGHNFDYIYSLFFHKQVNTLLMAVGKEGNNYKLKIYEGGSWNEKSMPSTMPNWLNESPVNWISYLDNPYFFSGEASGFYDVKEKTIKDLNEINKQWFISNGGDLANYVPIVGHSPVIHHNSLWIAGKGDYRNILFRTQNFNNIFYDIGTGGLPFLLWISVGGDDSASGSIEDEITGMAEWGDDIIVFKKNSIHRVIGGGYGVDYRPIPIPYTVGCTIPASIQKTNAGIIFYHNRKSGIWIYDGQVRNISKGRIDNILNTIKPNKATSGLFANRYYYLCIGDRTLIYDTQMDVWEVEDINYGGFAFFPDETATFLGAYNQYSTQLTQVIDPERPTEYQQILQETPIGCDIIEIGTGRTRNLNEDGTGGEEITFEVQTPFMDMGVRAYEKTWYEVVVHFKSADPILEMDVYVDNRAYKKLHGVVSPRPLYDKSYYNVDTYDHIPVYTTKFLLPMDCTGYLISFVFRISTKFLLRIEGIEIYYTIRGRYKTEDE